MKQLEEVREEKFVMLWPKEKDFSDWLSTPDALASFCKDIGLPELTAVRREYKASSKLKIDIFAESEKGEIVVIENQVTTADRKHLAQIIEYAAAVNANRVVWNVTETTDEREMAIRWLNLNCPKTEFNLVKVCTYKKGKENFVAFERIEPEEEIFPAEKLSDRLLTYVRYNFFWDFLQWISDKNKQITPSINLSSSEIEINKASTCCMLELNMDYRIKFTVKMYLNKPNGVIGAELCAKTPKAFEKIVSKTKAKKYTIVGRRLCVTKELKNIYTEKAQQLCFEWYMNQAQLLAKLY